MQPPNLRYVVENVLQSIGFDMAKQMKGSGTNFEDVIRLSSLGAKCQEVREDMGVSIKEVAAQLKVPQYRLKAVEGSGKSEILSDILEKYIAFLKLESWFKKWKSANPELEKRLGGLEQ